MRQFTVPNFPFDSSQIGRWILGRLGVWMNSRIEGDIITVDDSERPLSDVEADILEAQLLAAKPFDMWVLKAFVLNDASDVAVVGIRWVEGASIDLDVRGHAVNLPVIGGEGYLRFTATVPTRGRGVTIQAADPDVYGDGQRDVEAVTELPTDFDGAGEIPPGASVVDLVIQPTTEETVVYQAPFDFRAAFPSYAQAQAVVDDIANLAEAKVVLKRMVDAIYALGRHVLVSSD